MSDAFKLQKQIDIVYPLMPCMNQDKNSNFPKGL